MSGRSSVIVADDHPIFLDGVVAAIEARPDLRLLATAGDGLEALRRVRADAPDVLVLDLDLPGLDGFGVLEAIAAEEASTRVLIVSASHGAASVYRAIRLGAHGYLGKQARASELCDAIAAVARGQTVVAADLQESLASEVRLRRDAPEAPALTARELGVVRLSADGLSTAEMARELHVSPATVKTHLQHAFEKLGVSDRAAAVAKVMRAGLLR
ncbi:MAG TPA: response regulator transcription factor [Solirubrobacteraceae bacterium]|nr:response regulator transcription factor [Solirubrobacteraceae bacterium]